ncbi:hypothetical protein [Streptomyces sp. NPDC051098]|uniref:hypothetical protein n=1 Tax=Streptomyces sp. NPDC051098 TaxID=3155411 RepID=UPI00344737D6
MSPEADSSRTPARNERAKEILGTYGRLAWFRHPVERHPIYGYIQVPFIAWRYETPHEELRGTFESAARTAPKNVEWTFTSRKNWMIAPSRLVENSGPDGTMFNEAALAITTNDQEFCAAASEDLEAILQELTESQKHTGP